MDTDGATDAPAEAQGIASRSGAGDLRHRAALFRCTQKVRQGQAREARLFHDLPGQIRTNRWERGERDVNFTTGCPLPHARPCRSIYRLKRFALPTIRPVVSPKTRFPVWYRPGGTVPPPRILPFSKAKCSKSALGKGWGAWGEGERPNGGRRPCPLGDAGALRASTAKRGVPLPPSQTILVPI